MKKKILLISLMVCMFVCLLALTVGATTYDDESNGVKYTLHDGEEPYATVNDFIQGATVVTIPSTITVDGIVYKVTAFDTIKGTIPNYGNELFDIGSIQQKSSVQTLNITSEYITVIPRVLMRDCKSLKTLNITSPINHFMHECFFGCTAINNVYIKFDNTESIDQSAFMFSGNANNASQAIWNYNGEPINLYNVKNISPQAFASTRIGGKNVTGGQENTIIWPKKLETFGVFAFSNAHVGGTVYINAVSLLGLKGGEGNKQFSLNNYFETLIIGPDTKELRNFNNAKDNNKDNTIKANIKTVIILSKDVVNGKSRTNLFDNWGEFDLYYYADTTTATSIGKQTTIGSATQYFIDEYEFTYDSACELSLSLSATKTTDASVTKSENIVETNHLALSSEVTSPDCVNGGYTTYTCTACGDSYTDNVTEALGHSMSGWTLTTAPVYGKVGQETNECANCDYFEVRDYIAAAAIGNTYYASFEAALANAKAGDTIVLLAPVTVTEDTELNIEGITIESAGDAFVVTNGATLTLNGDFTVNAGTAGVGSWCAVWANGGHAVINGGSYSVGGDSSTSDFTHQNDLIYTKNGGTVTINGGTFVADNGVWALNENDKNRGTITVYGGTFVGFNPANNVSEGPNTSFLTDGLHATANGDVYTVEAHSFDTVSSIAYANGYGKSGVKVLECACGETKEESVDALFVVLGYSASEAELGGITVGYKMNNEAIAKYEEITGNELVYGVFAASAELLGNNDAIGADGTPTSGVIGADATSYNLNAFNLKLTGFNTEDLMAAEVVMGAYVIENATSVSYVQPSAPATGARYHVVSYNGLTGKEEE